jgi:hypothetical protein
MGFHFRFNYDFDIFMTSSGLTIFLVNLGKMLGKSVTLIIINYAEKGSVIINGSVEANSKE